MTDWEGFLEESHRRLVDLRTYGRAQDAHATPYVVLREISLWDAKQSAAFIPVLALSETAQSAIAREYSKVPDTSKKFQFRVPSIEGAVRGVHVLCRCSRMQRRGEGRRCVVTLRAFEVV